jgi:hypothetical protein
MAKITNIHNREQDHDITFNTTLIGFLDDTSWFASSKHQLEQNLQIANSFYDMANINTINYNKYVIPTNDLKMCNSPVELKIRTIRLSQFKPPLEMPAKEF